MRVKIGFVQLLPGINLGENLDKGFSSTTTSLNIVLGEKAGIYDR